ncbi:MAG: hypothetical protein Q9160_007261, partial [Pyrenula sp. 1 TL-2023]
MVASQYLDPATAATMTEHRREAVRLAKRQEEIVRKRAESSGTNVPEYEFDELIGKGSYGRVYLGHRRSAAKEVVAIKVIDIDDADYQAYGESKEEQILDFQKEIRVLRNAGESDAPNLNRMIEAFAVHSQLWLICEYCPGASVKTLMRATNNHLSERYIAVVARELAKALQGLHKAGIMHRDVKAANVLIHEEGRLQLCDFGVATVFDSQGDKRRTFIGTVHWMPPEMWGRELEYSGEVDVWGYGCTIFECATGNPPNADLREPQQLRTRMRRLNKAIELPEDAEFSDGLRSIVSYTLTPNQSDRPDMTKVLSHDYLINSEGSHPTVMLNELVRVYYAWLYGGGQRASLFIQAGAKDISLPDSQDNPDISDAWNFSTTEVFDKRISTVLNIPSLSELSEMDDQDTPTGKTQHTEPKEMTANEKLNFEERVKRGAGLGNLFDQNKPEYSYKAKTDFIPVEQRRVSDLPFRNTMVADDRYSIASNVLDLGDFDSSSYAAIPDVKLADAATIRATSKLYRDSSNDNLTAKRTTSSSSQDNEDQYYASDSGRNGPRPPTLAFSFPPKEWISEPTSPIASDLKDISNTSVTESSQTLKPEKPSLAKERVKTMEWSFAAAMSEASSTAPSVAGDTSPVQTDTDSFTSPPAASAPPPLLRTTTLPITTRDHVAAATIPIAEPRPSTAMSTASSHGMAPSESDFDADPFPLQVQPNDINNNNKPLDLSLASPESTYKADHGPDTSTSSSPSPSPHTADSSSDEPVTSSDNDGDGDGDLAEKIYIPELQPPDPKVLAPGASDDELVSEMERLLGDMSGLLGT